jgi:hypothetical protein
MFKGSGEKVRVGQFRGRSGPHHRELILSKNLATHHKEVLIIVFFVHVASYAASIAVIMFIFSQAISPLQISSPPSIPADYLHNPERKTCSMADACVPHQYAMHNFILFEIARPVPYCRLLAPIGQTRLLSMHFPEYI